MTNPSPLSESTVTPKPCPFCGAAVEVIGRWVRHTTGGNECPLTAKTFLAEKWNHRVSPSALSTDAERWRALVGCARLRFIGGAGNPLTHLGVEFWASHPHPTLPRDLAEFVAFVDSLPRPTSGDSTNG